MRSQKAADLLIPLVTLCLLVIGVLMVHSASTVLSQERFHDAFYYFKRQVLFAALGLLSMWLMSRLDYHFFQK